MKNLDDGEDSLNEAAFERALCGECKRTAGPRKPVLVAKQPTLSELERAYRAARAKAGMK